MSEFVFFLPAIDLKLAHAPRRPAGPVRPARRVRRGLRLPLPDAHPDHAGGQEEEAVAGRDVGSVVWGGQLVGGVEEPLGRPILPW